MTQIFIEVLSSNSDDVMIQQPQQKRKQGLEGLRQHSLKNAIPFDNILLFEIVPDNLRRYDANEVALFPNECTVTFIGNGQCDWEIQNNPHGQCDYDRKDCRESQECLELHKLLNAKDQDEKCTKVRNS